jgi:cell division septal protein FtsQ
LTRLSDGELKNIIWQQAQNHRLLFLKQSNLFLFDKQAAAEKILADFNFSSLEIKKKIPGTLEIRVGERSLAFIFQQGNDVLYSSRDGSVIKELVVAAADRSKYPLLENRSDDNLLGPDNKIDLTADYLSFLLELSDRLAAYPDLPLEKFIVTDELNALSAKFVNGPVVYFNTSLPVLDQVNRLLLVKKGKIKDNFNKVNYIDLRYGDRIFINPELP